ncbi:MAG: cytochrome c [Nitrospirae bacterium]|nr:cytochrome c [Nitrospirota bacterium]
MDRKKVVSMFTAIIMLIAAIAVAENHAHKSIVSGANPLIEEMMILDGVFREVVSAVAVGNGERVHKALHSMHGTMEKTHEGVHHGTVKIPKNAHRVKEFVKMDKQFHHNLELLAHAAEENDTKRMTTLTQKLLAACVSCHKTFR